MVVIQEMQAIRAQLDTTIGRHFRWSMETLEMEKAVLLWCGGAQNTRQN